MRLRGWRRVRIYVDVANVGESKLELLLLGLVAVYYLGTNVVDSRSGLSLLAANCPILAIFRLVVLTCICTILVGFISLLSIAPLSILLSFGLWPFMIGILLPCFSRILLSVGLQGSILI